MAIDLEGGKLVDDGRTWPLQVAPSSLSVFEAFVASILGGSSRDLLFRGQRDSGWPINSTFARPKVMQDLMRSPDGLDLAYKQLGLHLLNFVPSEELEASERDFGTDPYFELHRRIQQHPEEFDAQCRETGTLFVDWSLCLRVALTFACEVRTDEPPTDGIFYVLDPMALRDWNWPHSTIKAYAGLEKQRDRGQDVWPPMILRYPEKQHTYPRVERQQPVYTLQLDIACPLERAAERMERSADPVTGAKRAALYRVLIPSAMKLPINELLAAEGLTLDLLLDRTPSTPCDADVHQTPA